MNIIIIEICANTYAYLVDNSHVKVEGDRHASIVYFTHGYMYTPQQRSKISDGKIHHVH